MIRLQFGKTFNMQGLLESFLPSHVIFFLITQLLICTSSVLTFGQTPSFIINEIVIYGNTKTEKRILERELTFEIGDTIQKLEKHLKQSETNLQNTQLFHNVQIDFVQQGSMVNITVYVKERWYFWPIPILEYAESNLATYLRRQEPDYLNYGVILKQSNFRGLNQGLKVKIRLGVREQFGINYTIPQLKNKKNIGVYIDFSTFRQKELHNSIAEYRYVDLIEDHYIYHEYRILGGIKWRPGYYAKHMLYGGYRNFQFDNTIDSAFGSPITSMSMYMVVAYSLSYFRGDYIAYPLKGYKLDFDTEMAAGKKTIAYSTLNFGYHYPVFHRVTLSYGADLFISYTKNYPHYIFAGPGKTYYMRGFEDYAVHNDFFLINRCQIKYTLLKRKDFKFDKIPSPKFNNPFLKVFLNAFSEVGYTQNIHSVTETKKVPISFGMGLDFLTYYDWIGRFEITKNNRNETRINIHWGYIF